MHKNNVAQVKHVKDLSVSKKLLLGICFCIAVVSALACFIPVGSKLLSLYYQSGQEEGKERIAQIPSLEGDTLKIYVEWADKIIAGKYFKDAPKDIKEFVDQETLISNMKLMLEKRYYEDTKADGYAGPYGYSSVFLFQYPEKLEKALADYRQAYQYRWSKKALAEERAKQSIYTRIDYSKLYQKELTWSESFRKYVLPVLPLLLLCYLAAGLVSNIYFIPYLLLTGYSVKEVIWGEIFTLNLPAVNIAFPIMFPLFPWGNPKANMQLAMGRIAAVISLFIMNLGVLVLSASGQAKPKPSTKKDEYSLVEEKKEDASQYTDEYFNNLRHEGYRFNQTEQSAQKLSDISGDEVLGTVILDLPQSAKEQKPSKWKPKFTLTQSVSGGFVSPTGSFLEENPVATTSLKIDIANIYFQLSQSITLGKEFSSGSRANFGTAGVGVKFDCFRLDCDVGGTYINNSPLTKSGGDVLLGSFAISEKYQIYTTQTMTPKVTFRYFTPVNGKNPKAGGAVEVGTTYNFSPKNSPWKFDAYGGILIDRGAFGADKALIFKGRAQVNYKITSGATIFANANYYDPLTFVTDGRRPKIIFGGGVKYTW